MLRPRHASLAALLTAVLCVAPAQAGDAGIEAALAARAARDAEVARAIWGWAEVGYQERQSSVLLQGELKAAGIPTARTPNS